MAAMIASSTTAPATTRTVPAPPPEESPIGAGAAVPAGAAVVGADGGRVVVGRAAGRVVEGTVVAEGLTLGGVFANAFPFAEQRTWPTIESPMAMSPSRYMW